MRWSARCARGSSRATCRPGSHLSEVELAGAYGVGRHSLRAAFRELARDGLLVHEPNRGVRVPVPTADESEDLYRHRAALELGALRVALADGRSFAGIREPLALLEQMPADEPWDRVAVVHDAIHAAVVDAAGEPAPVGGLRRAAGRAAVLRDAHQAAVHGADDDRCPPPAGRCADQRRSGRAETALANDLAQGRDAIRAALAAG